MNKSENGHNKAIKSTIRLIKIDESSSPGLLIVDSTIFQTLLEFTPTDALQKFIDFELTEAPEPNDHKFGEWIKKCRVKLGLNQVKFAKYLNSNYKVKIHGSDIGNIELGLRKSNYTPARLYAIRAAVIKSSL